MNIKKTIIKNISWNFVAKILTPLIGFILIPFIISRLGKLEFGLITLISVFSLSGFLGILEFGLQPVVTKYVAEYQQNNDQEKLFKLLNTIFAVFIVIGITSSLIGLLSLNFLPRLFHIPENYSSSFKVVLLIVFFSYIFQFPDFLLQGVLGGLQRFDLLKALEIGGTLSYALFTFLLLIMGGNYVHILIMSSVLSFFVFILRFVLIFRLVPGFKIRKSYCDKNIIKEIKPMAKYVFLGKISSLLYNQTDRLLVGIFFGPISVGYYHILVRLPQFIKQIGGLGNQAVLPAASQISAMADNGKLRKLFQQGINFNLCFYYPIIIGAIYFSESFLYAWVGNDYVHLSTLLRFLLVWNLITPFLNYGPSILLGMNRRLKEMTIGTWVGTIIKVVITLTLIRNYELSAIVIGTVLSALFILPWYVYICLKEFDLYLTAFIKEVTIVLSVALLPLTVFSVMKPVISQYEIVNLLFQGSIWCLIYWGVLMATAIHPANRELILNFGHRVLKFRFS